MATLARSQTPPNLPAERFFRLSLFCLILTAVGTIVSTGKLDLFTSVVALAAILYKGYRWWRGHPAELQQKHATWLVISYLAVFPVDALLFSRLLVANSANPPMYAALIATVHFLIFVLIVRLYSATRDRDALFLAMLCFAAILASAVLTVDTTFLLLFFVFLLFGVATFAGLELRRGASGTLIATPAGALEHEHKLNRALGFAALAVAFGAIAIGVVLFFFFPRIRGGYLGGANLNPQLISGFSDEVELGQIGQIKKSYSLVMRVETGQPIAYPDLRWRGIALSNFDGKKWTTGERTAETLAANSDGWIRVPAAEIGAEGSTTTIRYSILLEPVATDAIFAPANVLALRGNFGGESATQSYRARRPFLFWDYTGSLSNPAHNFSTLRYTGMSRLPHWSKNALRSASTDYPREISATYLQLPDLDPRIRELAQSVTANAHNPYDKAATLESYLRTRYAYTLDLTGKPGNSPLSHFLFETKAGHCEYFASALAVMLRTLQIPSREVNGFLPGEFNDIGGDYIVRESEAHSWVEAYFPGNGWVTFDPTPSGPAIKPGIFSRLALIVDWIQLNWNEWIISYDFAHQMVLAQNLQRNSRSWNTSLREWFDRKQDQGRTSIRKWQIRHGAAAMSIPFVLVALLMGFRYGVFRKAFSVLNLKIQLRSQPSLKASPVLASRLYLELLRSLARRGIERGEAQTPFEFAAALPEPALKSAVREFTRLYADARFGGAHCNTLRLRELLSEIRATPRA